MKESLQRLVIQVVLAVTVLGCSASSEVAAIAEPPSGFPMAFAQDACAPWDGLAVSIYLVNEHMDGGTAPPFPHVSISIWRPAAEVGGQIIQWSGDNQSVGVAVRCQEAGKCQRAKSVKLRFRSREADGTIPGYVELEFEDGVSISGGFRATWRARRVLCG